MQPYQTIILTVTLIVFGALAAASVVCRIIDETKARKIGLIAAKSSKEDGLWLFGIAGLLWSIEGIVEIRGGNYFGGISRLIFMAETVVIVAAGVKCFFTEKGAFFPFRLKPREFTEKIMEDRMLFPHVGQSSCKALL